MAAQPVADLAPRVRRAIEGAGAVNPSGLTDDELEAAAADAIGDLILATGGAWGKVIEITPDTAGDPFDVELVVTVPAAARYLVGVGTGGGPVVVWGDMWEDPAPGGVPDTSRRTVVDSIEAGPDGFPARVTATPAEPVRLTIHATITLVAGGDQAQITAQNPDADQVYGQSDSFERTLSNAQHFAVTPELSFAEQGLVALQAALTFFVHALRTQKVAESIQTEGRQWSYQLSATTLRDVLKVLKEQRDLALAGLEEQAPVFARVASFIQAHDQLTSALVEPWVSGGGNEGGIVLWGQGTVR